MGLRLRKRIWPRKWHILWLLVCQIHFLRIQCHLLGKCLLHDIWIISIWSTCKKKKVRSSTCYSAPLWARPTAEALRYMARTKQRRTYLPYTFPAVAVCMNIAIYDHRALCPFLPLFVSDGQKLTKKLATNSLTTFV